MVNCYENIPMTKNVSIHHFLIHKQMTEMIFDAYMGDKELIYYSTNFFL